MPDFTDILRTQIASGQSGVIKNILANRGLVEGADGKTYKQRLLAYGLPKDNALDAALDLADIPKINDPHPTIPYLYVDGRSVEFADDSETICWVDVSYKRPTRSPSRSASETAKPIVEISMTLVTATTNKDNTGNSIEVYRQNKAEPSKPIAQPCVAQIQRPQLTVRLTRKEPKHPLFKNYAYMGRVNKGKFLDSPERTWLSAGITARSIDAGLTYECTYTFIYKEDTWDMTFYYLLNGLPIEKGADPAPKEGYEWGTFEIYGEADFTPLNIDIGGGGNSANQIGGGFVGI